ncbi:MAG: substrate-binding domain-containing protein [Salaquimonas sp.]
MKEFLTLRRFARKLALGLSLSLLPLSGAQAEDVITVQSTTSTRDSGLYDFILPVFQKESGIEVRVVAVGTGQAIRNAQDCNGDVLLVHSKPDEEKFVADGYGVKRYDLMYNDFVIVGPAADPSKVKEAKTVFDALKKIAETKSLFASRGDDSGTNKAELRLWEKAGFDPKAASGTWYLETGSGMGKTLNVAVGKNTYALSDRASWTKYGNKQDHVIVFEGDPPMFNQYGVMEVSSDKCPNVNAKAAATFVNWLISEQGQKTIADYKISGGQVFFPNANAAVN